MKTKIGIPIGLALVMFLGVFTAMLAFGALSPQPAEAQAGPSAAREISAARVDPGATVTVTITVSDASFGTITEMYPEGFTHVSHTGGSSVDTATAGTITSAYLSGDKPLVYTLTAPMTEGSYNFSGTLATTNDRADDVAIGGATSVKVASTTEPGAPTGLTAAANGQNQIDLSWTAPSSDGGTAITGYKIEVSMDGSTWTDLMADTASTGTSYSHTGLMAGSTRHYRVSAINSEGTGAASNTDMATTDAGPVVLDFKVNNTVMSPGGVSGYSFTFTTATDLVANRDTITVHFDKDFKGHGASLSRNHVTVSARHDTDATTGDSANIMQTGAYQPDTDATKDMLSSAHPLRHTPAGLTNSNVLGNIEYLISVPDMNGDEDGAPGIRAGSMVTVTISPAAGITNATEGGNKGPLGVYTSEQQQLVSGKVRIVRGIGMNDYDANRGKALTVIGKGFQNGTTAAVYLVKTDRGCDFDLDNIPAGATELVSEPVASDDTFQATFTVTVPPFAPGFGNCIYAQDGNEPPFSAGPVEFELEGLLTVSPTSAAVGDKVDITLEDWPNVSIPADAVKIANVTQEIIGNPSISGGSANFQIEISTDTPSGTNEIKVTTAQENDTKTITISGADLSASPTTAVPNQAITVNGQGFTGDGKINSAANDGSEVSLGGDGEALGYGDKNFNNGESVTVDSGGSWSATIIVPITDATTTPGTHELEVMDSGNRSGSVEITIPERTLTIEPAEARPGEMVTLTGSGFPATNTRSKEHTTPTVQITYDGGLVGTAIPDGEGNINLSFRVPLDAAIPSTNRVEANYMITSGGAPVEASVNHEIPGARVSLSMDEGKPGDSVTLTGDGFKAFASVEYVRIGGIEVTPAPRPATDRNGEFNATILVPDLAEGTNSIEVKVGVTAHANFKILDTSAAPGVMKPAAEAMTPADAFADLTAEDNLVKVYHFNKHEQNDPDTGGWSLYDTRDAFMSLNSIEMIEPGEFYWLMVNNEQLNVMLGSERVDLVAGWNQIRW